MPKKFIYVGAPVSLGRFGNVRKGDVLELTDHEARTIESDRGERRFKPFVEGKTKVPPPEGFDAAGWYMSLKQEERDAIQKGHAQQFTAVEAYHSLDEPGQQAAVARWQQLESDRKAALELANAKTYDENLAQMKPDDLKAEAERLRKAGKTVTFKKDASAKEMRAAIRIAMFGDANAGTRQQTETGEELPVHPNTLEEWIDAGNAPDTYPPEGFRARTDKDKDA